MCNALSEYTTFGIGGAARKIITARTAESLVEYAELGVVLGRGSNVLVGDGGYDGTVIINRADGVTISGSTATVLSGTPLARLCGVLAEHGLSGLEWAVGIPGSVGGAVRMNAGAFGGELSERLLHAEVLRRGEVVTLDKRALGFGYRSSGLLPTDIVVSATFALDTAEPNTAKKLCAEYRQRRAATQPSGKSAGSIFKNPEGVSIGKVFDEAGLKGLKRGGARISEKHANIIVNEGGATARDVCELIAVMKRVLSERKISATEEIIYLGNFI